MKLNENQYRQGDVMLVYVDATADDSRVVEPGQTVVLAHGEVTGHTHALRTKTTVKTPPSTPMFDAAAERYIRLLDSGELSHEEHSIALLRPGTIEIGIQVEAGPGNMLRQVAD